MVGQCSSGVSSMYVCGCEGGVRKGMMNLNGKAVKIHKGAHASVI